MVTYNDDTIITTKISCSEYACSVISLSERFILKNVFINVPKGSIYGLIGPSGCGKTTLLKCIMGIHNYNGQIILFGKKTISSKLIGYMPQSTSLYNDLTCFETLLLFARVSLISNPDDDINYFLNTLEIPKNLMVSELSGGQTRRLSLAIAMLHKPKLLILDEPTVGLDLMLCERIWSLLKDFTNEDNSVIITTHYIEEAIKTDNVSFLRNGHILIEDKPKNLIKHYQVKRLDEAFYHLCNQQLNNDLQVQEKFQYDISNIKEEKICTSPFSEIKNWFTQLKAISYFQLIRISRQSETFAQFVIPLIIVLIFCVCIGGTPANLKLAVINNDECECRTQDINSSSCICASELLLNSLNSYIYNKINYSDYEFAKNDVEKGKLWGVLYIPPKFTSSMLKFIDNGYYQHAQAIINADLINELLKRTVYQSVFRVNKELFRNLSSSLVFKSAIKLGEPIFDTDSTSYYIAIRDNILPGILILINYTISFALMALTYNLEKQHEITRFRLIGLSSKQIFLGHVATRFISSSISSLCLLIISVYILEIPCRGSFIAAYMLILSQVIYGIAIGTLISFFSKNLVGCAIFGNSLLIITFLLSGVVWSLEGLPYFLRWITYIQPTSLTIIGIRSIMIKSLSTWHITVLKGYFVTFIWIALIFTIQTKILGIFNVK